MKNILIITLLLLSAPSLLYSATTKSRRSGKGPSVTASRNLSVSEHRQPDKKTFEILKKVSLQQQLLERQRGSIRQTESAKKATRRAAAPRPRRALFLGRETVFPEAPPSYAAERGRKISPRARVAEQVTGGGALIDGRVSDTVYVGDNGHLTFSFAPGYVSAVINFYYDRDNDGELTEGDLVLDSDILLMDNDERDADPSEGGYSLPLNSSIFPVTTLIGSFIVTVDNFQTVSTARLVVLQRPASALVHITTVPPFANLVVYASTGGRTQYLFTDSTGSADLAVDRNLASELELSVYDVFGFASDYAPPSPRTFQILADTTVEEFTFTKGTSRIQGVCHDDAARGIAGVTLYAYGPTYSVRAMSDSAGAFSFAVQPGEWYVIAHPPSSEYIAPYSSPDVNVDSLATKTLSLTLQRANSNISGRVQYLLQGVGGVMVTTWSDTVDNSVLTAGDGSFTLPVLGPPLHANFYDVELSLGNYTYYVPDPQMQYVSPGTQGVLFTLLKAVGGIQGTVRDSLTGKPIPNASISLSGPTYASCTTDSSGWYHLPLRDGQYYVTVTASRHITSYAPMVTVTGAFVTLNIALYPSGTISGTVRDQSGSPLPSAEVIAYDYALSVYAEGVTDLSGRYLIDNIPAGSYVTSAHAIGYMIEYYPNTTDPQNAVPVNVQAGIETPNIDFVLSPGGSIEGFVVDKSGQPIPSATVVVYDTTYTYRSVAATNDSGRYLASGLATGSYIVYASQMNYSSTWYKNAPTFMTATRVPVIVNQVTPDIDFTLYHAGSISGTVRNNMQGPVPGAWVTVYDSLGEGYSSVTTDSSGRYTLGGLPPGSFKLYAWGNGVGQWYDHKTTFEQAGLVRLAPEENLSGIDFDLYTAGIYGLVVDDKSGTGVPWARITAATDDGASYSATSDQNGSYTLVPPAGEYAVRVECQYGEYACRFYYAQSGPVLLQKDAQKVEVREDVPGVRIDLRVPQAQSEIPCTLSNLEVTLTNFGVLSNFGDPNKPSGRWPSANSKDYLAQASPMVGGIFITAPWVYGDLYESTEGTWRPAMGFTQLGRFPQLTRSNVYSTDYFQAGHGMGIVIRQEIASWPQQDFILCRHTIFYDANMPSVYPEFSGIFTGLFADVDVSDGGQSDLVGVDTASGLLYTYEASKQGGTCVGMCALGPGPVNLTYWPASYDTAFHDVGAKYATLAAGSSHEDATQPADYRLMLSYGPFTLHRGDSISTMIALVAGNGLPGLSAAAQAARVAYHTLSARETAQRIPEAFSLAQNYPNPFNPSTTISFDLPHQSPVVLKVYNMLGQEVCTLVNGVRPAGHYSVQWFAGSAASGVYFCTIKAASYVQSRKMVLLK